MNPQPCSGCWLTFRLPKEDFFPSLGDGQFHSSKGLVLLPSAPWTGGRSAIELFAEVRNLFFNWSQVDFPIRSFSETKRFMRLAIISLAIIVIDKAVIQINKFISAAKLAFCVGVAILGRAKF